MLGGAEADGRSSARSYASTSAVDRMRSEKAMAMASEEWHGKTAGQILLRWAVQSAAQKHHLGKAEGD